jgi:hypothetical protein
MIVSDKKVRTVEQSAPLDQMEYFIDQKNIVHITAMLRNMYSNPVKACVREYCANALDGHLQANKLTTPIEVTVPSALAPTFKVRDFGPGLSVEETKQLLCGFGSSGEHKRNSNNYIGGFGIGAKVGFAVSANFMYTIWHGGKKRVWSNFLDELDASRATLLSEEDSDEPTGVEVSVPVTASQIDSFNAEIKTAFAWYPVLPTIKGVDLVCDKKSQYIVSSKLFVGQQEITIGLRHASDEAKQNQALRYHYSDLKTEIVMGHLVYPVEISEQTTGINPGNLELRDRIVLNRLTIEAPVGLVQLAPNREALQYSQRTRSLLNKLLSKILDENYLQTMIKEQVPATTSLKDALKIVLLYSDLFDIREGNLLRELYPQYKCFSLLDSSTQSKTPQYYLWLLPGIPFTQTDETPLATKYQQAEFGSGFSRLNHTWKTGWVLQTNSHPATLAFLDPKTRVFLVTGAIRNAKDWIVRRIIHIKNLVDENKNPLRRICVVIVPETESAAASQPYWAAVTHGVVEHVDVEKLNSVTPGEANQVELLATTSRRHYSRGGARTIHAHHRKFTVLTRNSRGANNSNSDRWQATEAKTVTEESVWSVAIDGFLVKDPGSCVTLAGTYNDKPAHASHSVTNWLQDSLLSDSTRKEVLLNREIAGIRTREYTKTVERYELTSLWTRLKQYVSEIKTEFKLTNDHLALAYLMCTEDLGKMTSLLLNSASIKLLNLVFKHVSSNCDASHPLWEASSYWGPIFEETLKLVFSPRDSRLGIFHQFFLATCRHWVGSIHIAEGCPLFLLPEDKKYWDTFMALWCGDHNAKGPYRADMRWRGQVNTSDPVSKTIQEIYANWPGLSTFLSGHNSRGYADKETTTVEDRTWPLISGKEDKTRNIVPGNVKEHIAEYLKVAPLKGKVEKTW